MGERFVSRDERLGGRARRAFESLLRGRVVLRDARIPGGQS